jgi:hypothetical protein
MSTICNVIGNPLEAVYNQLPMPNVSKRYEFFPTYKVIEFMADHGFEASRMQGLSRKVSKNPEYAKHLVTFRKFGQMTLDDGVPELVFVNSHNRSSSANLMVGFFRWACSNGCIFGKFTDQSRILHTSNNPFDDLLQLIEMGVQSIDDKIKRITDMKNIFLSYEDQQEYAEDAARLRGVSDPRELMYAHRSEDRSNSLWMTYNKAQEALLRGKYSQFNPAKGHRKARPIGSVAETVRINTKLWKITERFLETA